MTPKRRPPSPEQTPADPRPSSEPSPVASSPADDSAGRSAELADLIRAEIEAAPDGRITFARFMERALYEPRLGYYRQRADRPTDAGDFLTAPETHPIFGRTIARRIEEMWVDLGRPSPFGLIEHGAGSGTLGLSVLDGFRRHGADDLLRSIRYEPVESNPYRLADLHQRFQKVGFADRLASSSPDGTAGGTASEGPVPVTGVILANEFLDALPVHRVVVRGGKLLELFVVWRDGADGSASRFAEVVAEPSIPELAARLADDGIEPGQMAEGQVAEICLGLEPWLDEVAARLARGFVLVIDYGYPAAELYGPRRLAGSLLGYRSHRVVDDPFADVGLTDLTAHVDFTAVQRLAARRGFGSAGLTTQQEFLVAAGLESELRALQASPELTLTDYARARSGIVRMLDPRHMGRFRVLTLGRG
ncbi:MAG TPA: SAM-dependent methyltransferase [Candidatus Limnocylindrales bacterium]